MVVGCGARGRAAGSSSGQSIKNEPCEPVRMLHCVVSGFHFAPLYSYSSSSSSSLSLLRQIHVPIAFVKQDTRTIASLVVHAASVIQVIVR